MFFDAFYADPMTYIGAAFALIATFGVVLFIAGFFAGLPHLFTISGHEGHLEHHRERATWGVMILLYTFMLWEVVRLVASWFGWGGNVDPSIVVHLLVAYVIVIAIIGAWYAIAHTITHSGH